MKNLTIILAFLAFSTFSFAQGAAPLTKGQKEMNFGVGFGDGLPAYWGMDFAVHNDITIGGVVAANLNGFDYIKINAKGDYHFNRIIGIPNNFDFYAGLTVGFKMDINGNDNKNNSGLHIDAHVGGRWFWSEKWGLNLEIGGGNGFGTTFGLTMKM